MLNKRTDFKNKFHQKVLQSIIHLYHNTVAINLFRVFASFVFMIKLHPSQKFEKEREGEVGGTPNWHLAMLIGGNKQRMPNL